VSARDWRAVREGETHAAAKTSTNNTPESFIVGVGASGALLAGAAIVFVTLVGLVSFNVWPSGAAVGVNANVELSRATPANPSAATTTTPVSAASGQVASTSVGTGTGTSSGSTGGGGNDQGGGDKGNQPKSQPKTPPATSPAPTTTTETGDTGDTGSDPRTPGNASKSPSHPVHPSHPGNPHQNTSNGPKGKDDPSGSDSSGRVNGKGPFTKPSPPPSTDSETSETDKGHGSAKGKSKH
jgi:hypothetical protein